MFTETDFNANDIRGHKLFPGTHDETNLNQFGKAR